MRLGSGYILDDGPSFHNQVEEGCPTLPAPARACRAPARLGSRSPIGHGFRERFIRLFYGQQNRGPGARHSASLLFLK